MEVKTYIVDDTDIYRHSCAVLESSLHEIDAAFPEDNEAFYLVDTPYSTDDLRELNYPETQLSPREQQCLDLHAGGESDAEIAGELGIALGTVKKYLETVRFKLNSAETTEEAVAWAGFQALSKSVTDDN